MSLDDGFSLWLKFGFWWFLNDDVFDLVVVLFLFLDGLLEDLTLDFGEGIIVGDVLSHCIAVPTHFQNHLLPGLVVFFWLDWLLELLLHSALLLLGFVQVLSSIVEFLRGYGLSHVEVFLL
jgi:hypothetical protein